MSENGIGRRQLVRTAAGVAAGGVLAVGTGAGTASAHDSGDHSGHGLLGAWLVSHTNDPPAEPEPGLTVVAFAHGGVVTASDIRPAGPTGTGAWSADGNRFRLNYWAPLLGPDGEDVGSVNIQARGRVRKGAAVGTFAVTGYAPDGTTVIFSATGTFTGTRLKA